MTLKIQENKTEPKLKGNIVGDKRERKSCNTRNSPYVLTLDLIICSMEDTEL